jgi:hypothetical protein
MFKEKKNLSYTKMKKEKDAQPQIPYFVEKEEEE